MEGGALKRPLFGCSLLFALAAVFCAYFPDTNRHTAFAVCLFFVCAALVFLHKLRVLTAAMLLAAYLAGLPLVVKPVQAALGNPELLRLRQAARVFSFQEK